MITIGVMAALAAVTPVAESSARAATSKPLCPRVAEQLPMLPPKAESKAWRFDTRAGIKGLFSGSVTSQIGAGPVDQDDGKAWQRASAMCVRTAKGGECRLEGPVVFLVRFDEKEFAWQLEPGEKMLFRLKGTVMECEELSAARRNDADV